MYSERPIKSKKEDEFGIAHLADKIYEIITIERKNSSYILGINGRIGIGKTSLMNLIKEKIKEKKEFKIISFNPWYYKDLESLINGFIQQVKEKPFVEFLKTIILNVVSIISINLGPFELSLREIKKKQSIEEATEKFKKWLRSKKIFFLIFIDDLDRCDKKEIHLVLKLMREFLNLPKIFIIVGYDKEILKEKAEMDIEKFVDLEVPLNIEKEKIINWFFKEIINWFFKELEKVEKDIKNKIAEAFELSDFKMIIYEYFDTPRKAKQILNDLILTYPLVKGKVNFLSFLILAIMRREILSLYNFLAKGGYWILQKLPEEFIKNSQLLEKEINTIIERILKEEKKEGDRNLRLKICRYLNLLSYDIGYGIIVNTGEIQISLKRRAEQIGLKTIDKEEILKQSLLFSEKAIFNKHYTEAYFIFRYPSYTYEDESFEHLLEVLSSIEKEKAERVKCEIKNCEKNGKLESFLEIIKNNVGIIFDKKLENAFIIGFALLEKYPYEFTNQISSVVVRLMGSLIFKEYLEENLKNWLTFIENCQNPYLLFSFYPFVPQDENIRSKIESKIKFRIKKILIEDKKCVFCDFGLKDNQLGFLSLIKEEIDEYIKKLSEKEHSQCASKIEYFKDETLKMK
jgi:hypothetical protein